MPQDMPPKGGYPGVQFQRYLPLGRFRPRTIMAGLGVIMAYGWYKLIVSIRERNELAREKVWSRIYLTPLLQAEGDRDDVRRHLADKAREKELLGGNFKVYNNDDRFVRPTIAAVPSETKG